MSNFPSSPCFNDQNPSLRFLSKTMVQFGLTFITPHCLYSDEPYIPQSGDLFFLFWFSLSQLVYFLPSVFLKKKTNSHVIQRHLFFIHSLHMSPLLKLELVPKFTNAIGFFMKSKDPSTYWPSPILFVYLLRHFAMSIEGITYFYVKP